MNEWCQYVGPLSSGYEHPNECDDRCIAYWREKDETCVDICGKDCRKYDE